MSTVDRLNGNTVENDHQLRKRRGSYPQLRSGETLSSEMLAPLPQANIPRQSSSIFNEKDNETRPLLTVKNKLNNESDFNVYFLV